METVNMQTLYRTGENGSFLNPIIWSDIPDPDVIRVGDTYYMTSTTMYFSPGVPVMKSYDLIHWEIVNYVYDILDDNDDNALRNGCSAYGKGSWASSLRFHNGIYYVSFCALNTKKTYIYQTEDIENGSWRKSVIDGIYHDSSLLFDDDGRVFLVYGSGTVRIAQLNAQATALLPGGLDAVIIEKANVGGDSGLPAEGAHMYKIDGRYYLFLIAWPHTGTKRRIELCYRAESIDGPYEGRVVLDDDMGFFNNGVAQGGIVDTPDGDIYAMLFQDHGAVGRIPVLLPVYWQDGFPVFGVGGRVPESIMPVSDRVVQNNIVASDDFDSGLAPCWQWNHNPVNHLWSLTERPGFLRLKSSRIFNNLLQAQNTLTQRTFGPVCTGTAALDTQGMRDGDTAGLAALQELYGFVGVKCENGFKYIIVENTTDKNDIKDDIKDDKAEINNISAEKIPLKQERVYLRITFDFEDNDTARFYYSLDEQNWHNIGSPLHMQYRLSHFTGYRFALFYYAAQAPGGCADFDYFKWKQAFSAR